MTQYVVLNEHTLGYLQWDAHSLDVLAGKVLKGGHDPKNGPCAVLEGFDKLRPATHADFADYRVSAKGHLPAHDQFSEDFW